MNKAAKCMVDQRHQERCLSWGYSAVIGCYWRGVLVVETVEGAAGGYRSKGCLACRSGGMYNLARG